MKALTLMLAATLAGPAMAADSPVSTDQATQRLISRSGGNLSDVTQSGVTNNAETNQSGSGNSAYILQQGSGNSSVISQQGSGLSAESLQTGGAGVRIDQSGAAGNIRVQQTGPGAGGATIFQQGQGTATVR